MNLCLHNSCQKDSAESAALTQFQRYVWHSNFTKPTIVYRKHYYIGQKYVVQSVSLWLGVEFQIDLLSKTWLPDGAAE